MAFLVWNIISDNCVKRFPHMSHSLQFGKYIDIYGLKHQIGRFECLGCKINAPSHLVKNQLANRHLVKTLSKKTIKTFDQMAGSHLCQPNICWPNVCWPNVCWLNYLKQMLVGQMPIVYHWPNACWPLNKCL